MSFKGWDGTRSSPGSNKPPSGSLDAGKHNLASISLSGNSPGLNTRMPCHDPSAKGNMHTVNFSQLNCCRLCT